jgi:hypothetical protein
MSLSSKELLLSAQRLSLKILPDSVITAFGFKEVKAMHDAYDRFLFQKKIMQTAIDQANDHGTAVIEEIKEIVRIFNDHANEIGLRHICANNRSKYNAHGASKPGSIDIDFDVEAEGAVVEFSNRFLSGKKSMTSSVESRADYFRRVKSTKESMEREPSIAEQRYTSDHPLINALNITFRFMADNNQAFAANGQSLSSGKILHAKVGEARPFAVEENMREINFSFPLTADHANQSMTDMIVGFDSAVKNMGNTLASLIAENIDKRAGRAVGTTHSIINNSLIARYA